MSDIRIQMVDLESQYLRLKNEIDQAMQSVLYSSAFINGPEVKQFSTSLAEYLNVPYVVPCGNGTDALQIALMALDLKPGDEVIVPAFNYIAAAEAAVLLGLTPVLIDVDLSTYNMNIEQIEDVVSSRTKAIIAVHLFGQSVDMDPLMRFAEKQGLYVIEDNAQSLGTDYTFRDGTICKTGCIGHIGITSFFPTKQLACYGDGGAIITRDEELAARVKMIASHGQSVKYQHQIVGCNSRLDTLQAAVLNVKLTYLTKFLEARRKAAVFYDAKLSDCDALCIPQKADYSSHGYNQYTIRVKDGKRDSLRAYLKESGIPSMIYYPMPLHCQKAYSRIVHRPVPLRNSMQLCSEVLSLPMHTELTETQQSYIVKQILSGLGK